MTNVVAVVAAWLTVLCVTPAFAVLIEVVPSASEIGPGDPVTVRLAISGLGAGSAPSVSTFDLDAGFDPSVLAFAGAGFGDPSLGDQLDVLELGSQFLATPGSGTVNLFEISLDSAANLNALQASAFVLATLTFEAVGPGESPLTLTLNALGDAEGQALETDLDPARVIVRSGGPVPVTAPAAALLLTLGLILVAALRT
jgi:hypothetical protein